MNHSEFKAKTRRWNQFSDVDTLGSFDFFTNIISLDAVRKEHLDIARSSFLDASLEDFLEQKLNPDQYSALAKFVPLAVHEYTHFVDSTSTLWGLRHLELMNQAYLSHTRYGGQETEFYSAKKFYDHVRNIRLPTYYTLVEKGPVNSTPWRYEITLGKTYDSDGKISRKPVLFTWFNNHEDVPIARSPISTVAVLEASAMAQEIYSQAILINRTEDDFKLIEGHRYTEGMLSYLYNREITEYSVCLHLLANQLGSKDAAYAYPLCGALTRLVLNFSKNSFFALKKRCQIHKILNVKKDEEFVIRIREGLANYDIGILFYLICRALPANLNYYDHSNIDVGIDTALNALGIAREELLRDALAERDKIVSNVIKSPIKPLSILCRAGADNFGRIGISDPHLKLGSLNLPPVLLGDSTEALIFPSPKNSLGNFDIDQCFDELFSGQLWVENFTEACL